MHITGRAREVFRQHPKHSNQNMDGGKKELLGYWDPCEIKQRGTDLEFSSMSFNWDPNANKERNNPRFSIKMMPTDYRNFSRHRLALKPHKASGYTVYWGTCLMMYTIKHL